MDGTECNFKLGGNIDGDAVIYRGCDLEHWRNMLQGGKDYRLVKVFLHYINKDELHYPEFAYDKKPYKLFESDL